MFRPFIHFSLCALISFCLVLCDNSFPKQPNHLQLNIVHAGSLTIPVKIICDSFKNRFSQIKIYTEACGSRQCARNIVELNKEYDVFISADYNIVEQMLIPKFATWYIPFASNEMVIVYNEKSAYANEINKNNWFKILLKKDVVYSRSDPNSDPCGIRSVLTIKLAEKYYGCKGLSSKLLLKDNSFIRPKETDLLALLETNSVDFLFIYKSIALQHHLKYISLPDEINLSNPKYKDLYKTVSTEVNGTKPDEKILVNGEPMVYCITIPSNCKNKKTAEAFVYYFLSKGLLTLKSNGQPILINCETSTFNNIPSRLKKFAKQKNETIQ